MRLASVCRRGARRDALGRDAATSSAPGEGSPVPLACRRGGVGARRRRLADAAHAGRRARAPAVGLAVFRRGEEGAHEVRNDGDAVARRLLLHRRPIRRSSSTRTAARSGVRWRSRSSVSRWAAEVRGGVELRGRHERGVQPPRRRAAGRGATEPATRHRRRRVGATLGADLLGAHAVRDAARREALAVSLGARLRGVPRRRRGDADACARPTASASSSPGDVVHFPQGEPGAHQLINRSEALFRVLIGSTKPDLAVAGYPDSGKLLRHCADLRRRQVVVRDVPVDYWDGE